MALIGTVPQGNLASDAWSGATRVRLRRPESLPPSKRHKRATEGGSRAGALGRVLSQSACLRRKAGISKSSMPPDDRASTLAAAWVRLVRQTLGTAMEW